MRSDYDYGDDYGIRVERTSPPRSPGRGRDQPRERESWNRARLRRRRDRRGAESCVCLGPMNTTISMFDIL